MDWIVIYHKLTILGLAIVKDIIPKENRAVLASWWIEHIQYYLAYRDKDDPENCWCVDINEDIHPDKLLEIVSQNTEIFKIILTTVNLQKVVLTDKIWADTKVTYLINHNLLPVTF